MTKTTIDFIPALKKIFSMALIFFSCQSITYGQIPVRNDSGYLLMWDDGELFDSSYDFIGEKSGNHFVMVKSGKWGYLNGVGKESIAPRYDVAYPFKGMFALVGKDKKYYHITQSNDQLAMYDTPLAPIVFDNQFLVVNGDAQEVYNYLGTKIYTSSHELFCAPNTGIIEWNKDLDSLTLYKGAHSGERLIKIMGFSDVSSFTVTKQGYLCLVSIEDSLKKYTLLGKYGTFLGSYTGPNINPHNIRLVWRNYIFWGEGITDYPERVHGVEVHFPMKYLTHINNNNPTKLPLQLCEKYEDEQVALIPEILKWLPFDGYSVEGSRMFDDVYSGDRKMTPVKIYDQWYLYSPREDSLIHTGYNQIHPAGYNNYCFFAGNENPNTYSQKWAFLNLRENIKTDNVFGVPVNNQQAVHLFENYTVYDWKSELNEVVYLGRQSYINRQGEVVWSNPIGKGLTPNDFFRIEFHLSNYLLAELPKNHGYKKKEFQVVLSKNKNGLEVSIANTTRKEVLIEVQDGNFMAQLEQKTTDGSWQVIAWLDPSDCGNSYYPYLFPPNGIASTSVSLPNGDTEVMLRVTVKNDNTKEDLISNSIIVKTNSGRLWVKEYVGGFGIEGQKLVH
jgi:hypothetical protein